MNVFGGILESACLSVWKNLEFVVLERGKFSMNLCSLQLCITVVYPYTVQ